MPANKNNIQWNATVKAYPAIADLQAIESFVRVNVIESDVGAPNYEHDVYTVPLGKIFVMEFLMGECIQADPTNIHFILRSGGYDYVFYSMAYGAGAEQHRWSIPIKFDEGEVVRILWTDTLATTDVIGTVFGYLIDKY